MSQDQIINPYQNKEFGTIVKLQPNQLDGTYYLHLKKNIEKKVIGKCNNIGLFTKVIRLTEYDDNIINTEDFSACAEYKVKYIATICMPVLHSLVILKIERIIFQFNDFLINAENGAITCILATKHNLHLLSIKDGKLYIESQDKYLVEGDYIKIKIKTKNIEPHDRKIKIIGTIIDVATEDEVSEFYSNNVVIDESEPILDNVQFNEDTDYNIQEETNLELSKSAYSDV